MPNDFIDCITVDLFSVFFFRGDKVVAVASMNSDPVVSRFAEFIASGKELTKSEVQ